MAAVPFLGSRRLVIMGGLICAAIINPGYGRTDL